MTRVLLVLSILFLSSSLFAQQTITGKVIGGADNQPVPFATVQVKGERGATQTGTDGTFSIRIAKSSGTLIISAVGFETQQVPIAGNAMLGTITLKAATTTLNDIVVTGYTAQKKKDITGAVAVVDIGDAKKIPATSSEQLLQGQASGVTVINSGAPGGASTVFVRGISNFGATQPLYVVDGVQVGDMSLVNPNDIESISVLKDAGSAAIYGIAGGNGVVVITTKKGKQGRTVINYDAFYGDQQPLAGNPYHIMTPVQHSIVTWRAGIGDTSLYPGGPGVIPTYGYHGPAAPPNTNFGPSGVTSDPTIANFYNFDAANPGNDFLVQKFAATGSGTNWWQTVFKPAPEMSHTLSASGGGDRSNYYLSFNYLDQKGTLLNNYEKRYAVRINTNFAVKDHIHFGENAMITYKENNGGYNGTEQQEGGPIAYIFREMPLIPVFDIKGHYGGGYDGPGGEPLGNGSNPYAILDRQKTNQAHFVYVEGNVFAQVDFLQHFTVRSAIGGRLYNQYYWSLGYNTYENYETHTSPNSASENEQMLSQYNWTNTATYKQTFGKHDIQVLGGAELKGTTGRFLDAGAQQFFSLSPNYVELQYGNQSQTPATSTIIQPTSTASFFGRVDYQYDEKYLLGATIRRDGYSVFGPGDQWGNFPSVSLGWRISQEDFMKSLTWIDQLKLRGSYGVAGNNGNVYANDVANAFASGAGSSYYGITGNSTSTTQGFYQSQMGNPLVAWEKDKITNVGLDATIFRRFDMSVEWYKKAISGLLFQGGVPALAGGGNHPVINVGDVQNTGVDISATYHGTVNKDFTFSIGANITTYKSLITSIPYTGYFDFGYNRDLPIVRNEVGHPIGEFFGLQTEGLYQSDADAAKGPTYKGAKAGSYRYEAINGDTSISAADRVFLGNPNPKFTYGINLNANYMGFDFTMVLYGSYGNKDWNYVKYWTDFYGTFEGGKNVDLYNKAAIVSGGVVTNPGATLPAASYLQDLGSSFMSSMYLESGSFLKCRVMQLGYTINPVSLKKAGIDKLHFYFQVTNAFMITKYTGPDPELMPSISNNGTGVNQSAAFGIDYGAYPNNQRQFIGGINLTF
ncbi:MAG TPA: SusC/RagA family TonB-linked outer membrane protein [Puia sp.]|nr:SusC/RagA family TonB-linked outer membrane protein [Puia sp.]